MNITQIINNSLRYMDKPHRQWMASGEKTYINGVSVHYLAWPDRCEVTVIGRHEANHYAFKPKTDNDIEWYLVSEDALLIPRAVEITGNRPGRLLLEVVRIEDVMEINANV